MLGIGKTAVEKTIKTFKFNFLNLVKFLDYSFLNLRFKKISFLNFRQIVA